MQSGTIKYNDEQFNFEFENNNLLIGYDGDEYFRDIDSNYLVGSLFPNKIKTIFYRENGFGNVSNPSKRNIDMSIKYNSKDDSIYKVQFELSELDNIYKLNSNFISFNMNDFFEKNESSCKIASFDKMNTQKYNVTLDYDMTFYIEMAYSLNTSSLEPLKFKIYFSVEYNFGNDYDLIYKLIKNVEKLFSFLSFRKNISFKSILINSKNEEGKFYNIGSINYINRLYPIKVDEMYLNNFYILYDSINYCIDKIFQNVIDENIELRYLPKSDLFISVYEPDRIIMITSTFEFEYKLIFNNKINHSTKTIERREKLFNKLEIIKEEFNSEGKNEISRLQNILNSENFGSKVNEVFKEYNFIEEKISKFYSYNGANFVKHNYTAQIEKISNSIAHCNIDCAMSSSRILCVRALEIINYILQLKYCGVEENDINSILYRIFRI